MGENFKDIKEAELYVENYFNDICSKSIYDYLKDRYNDEKKIYEEALESFRNIKIKDILVKKNTNDNNLTFETYHYRVIDDKNIHYNFQKLENFKNLFITKTIDYYNESIQNHNKINVNNFIKTAIESMLRVSPFHGASSFHFFSQFDYIKNKIFFDIDIYKSEQQKINHELIKKFKINDEIIDNIIANNQDLILRIENQEKELTKKFKINDEIIENYKKTNKDFILRIVSQEEKINNLLLEYKNQNAIIQYLISNNEDQKNINKEIIAKIEDYEEKQNTKIDFQKGKTFDMFIYLLFSIYTFIIYSIISK